MTCSATALYVGTVMALEAEVWDSALDVRVALLVSAKEFRAKPGQGMYCMILLCVLSPRFPAVSTPAIAGSAGRHHLQTCCTSVPSA